MIEFGNKIINLQALDVQTLGHYRVEIPIQSLVRVCERAMRVGAVGVRGCGVAQAFRT